MKEGNATDDSICAVIFDLDGVLVDSGPAHRESWKALGRELGIEVSDQAFASTFGRHNADIIPILFGSNHSAEQMRQLADRKEALYRELVADGPPAVEGAVELVEYYRVQGHRLAIASSTPRANVDLALRGLRLEHVFSVIVSGEDVARGKPDPEVFLKAARRLDVAPPKCLVIEDSLAGLAAARAAGMQTVALARGTQSRPNVGSEKCGLAHARQPEHFPDAHRVVRCLTELIADRPESRPF